MSSLGDLAESMSAGATFFTSAIGTGLISFGLVQTKSCSGGGILDSGPVTCENVFGSTPMTTDAAGVTGTVIGFAVGLLLLGVRELILDHERKRDGAG
jgi:hypothetical protein